MVPCTLSDIIVPETCIITSVDIVVEREDVLRKSGVPQEDGSIRKHDNFGEAMVGPTTTNIDQSPPTHIPTTNTTVMMIW